MMSEAKARVTLTAAALVLWVIVGIMAAATSSSEGANIGAGIVGIFALIVSVAACWAIALAPGSQARTASLISASLWLTAAALALADVGGARAVLIVGVGAIAAMSLGCVLSVRQRPSQSAHPD
jgi:D-arabinose 1-dehydrogenase-like Zn-dependent alcohol dehydrogenase